MRATLQDRGISGVTIEEVYRRSVAKTTIYRRYHNADELLHEISAMYLAIPDSDPVPSRVSISRNFCRWSIGCATTTSTSKRVGINIVQRGGFFQHRRPGGDPVAGACGGVPQASRAGRVCGR